MLADDLLAFVNAEISLDPSMPVDLTTDLLLTGLVDSLGVVEIVAWLEARFDGEIDPADVVLEHFQTVQRMVDYATIRFPGAA